MGPEEVNSTQFTLDEKTLGLIIEAILTKIKNTVGKTVTKEGLGEEDWNKFVQAVITGGELSSVDVSDETAVSVELLKAILAGSNHLKYKVVEGEDIDTAVPDPKYNTLYLLRKDTETKTNLAIYLRVEDESEDYWLTAGGLDIPVFQFLNIEDPDHVKNVVAHINAGNDNYSTSANVRATDIVTVRGLTQVLVQLAYGRKIIIGYDQSKGNPINVTVPKPDLHAFYVYQQSENEEDWAVYTAVKVAVAGEEDPQPEEEVQTKYVWLKIAGGTGGADVVEVDLSNYWSKDELKPITEEQISSIVEAAAEKAGL